MAEEFKQLLNLLNSEDNSVRQSAEDKYASLGMFKNSKTILIHSELRFLNFSETRLKNYNFLFQQRPIIVFQMALEHWLLFYFAEHSLVNGKNRGKFYLMI